MTFNDGEEFNTVGLKVDGVAANNPRTGWPTSGLAIQKTTSLLALDCTLTPTRHGWPDASTARICTWGLRTPSLRLARSGRARSTPQ